MTRYYGVIVHEDGTAALGTFADEDAAEGFYLRHVDDYDVRVFGYIGGVFYLAVYTPKKAVKL